MAEYIEREELISKFKQMKLGENSLVEKLFSDGVYATIKAFPAADVVPVVHGHWIHLKNGEVHCSVCNALTCVGSDLSEMTKDIFYCYNCGAKMDGGADRETDQ